MWVIAQLFLGGLGAPRDQPFRLGVVLHPFGMADEGFDFEECRARFPAHWDHDGWTAQNSTWQRGTTRTCAVHVIGRAFDSSFQELVTMIYLAGTVEELRGLFTYEPSERWNLGRHGLVYE